jgi:cytosine/adenosine deaminase-related metal-dependent hydrolase
MRVFSFVLVLLFAVAAFAGPASNDPVPRRIWITDITIVSPENLVHLDRGSVLIENERIVRVERQAKAKPPADATVVSGGGGFLIPSSTRTSILRQFRGLRPS